MIPNKGNDMHIHEILESVVVERAYLIGELNVSMENKVSLITSMNNSHICHREQLK